jgi:hypothetical protein
LVTNGIPEAPEKVVGARGGPILSEPSRRLGKVDAKWSNVNGRREFNVQSRAFLQGIVAGGVNSCRVFRLL